MIKRGQMKLSFGMIFSIILIVIFIAFAFYAIQKFLDIQKYTQIKQFVNNLQSDIDKMWAGTQGSQEVEYFLPSKIESVCFTNDAYENLNFKSSEFIQGEKLTHINIEKITENKDPFCIETIKGKVKMTIKKDYGEALVMINKINR